jgi:cytochrome b involved in lipid metabolism
MDEHPCCPEILLQEAGKGASKALADAGDGFYAEGLSKEYYIGNLAGQSSLGAQAWPRIMRHRTRPGQPSASPK